MPRTKVSTSTAKSRSRSKSRSLSKKSAVGYGETVNFSDITRCRKYQVPNAHGVMTSKNEPGTCKVIPISDYNVLYHRRYYNGVAEPIVRRMLIADNPLNKGKKISKIVKPETYDASNINHKNAKKVVMGARKTQKSRKSKSHSRSRSRSASKSRSKSRSRTRAKKTRAKRTTSRSTSRSASRSVSRGSRSKSRSKSHSKSKAKKPTYRKSPRKTTTRSRK